MSIVVQTILWVGCVVAFRVLIGKFCDCTEFKVRLACAAGMMAVYTALLVQMIFFASELALETMTVADFRTYICVLICGWNLVLIFIVTVYCSTARKRALSNREKIMLKDL